MGKKKKKTKFQKEFKKNISETKKCTWCGKLASHIIEEKNQAGATILNYVCRKDIHNLFHTISNKGHYSRLMKEHFDERLNYDWIPKNKQK